MLVGSGAEGEDALRTAGGTPALLTKRSEEAVGMRKVFIAVGLIVASAVLVSAQAQDIAGDWQGTLDAGVAQLRLVLHITKNADGSLHAALDSVDQGANGIPASITRQESKVHLDLPAVRGTYDGTLSADGAAIKGSWSQG